MSDRIEAEILDVLGEEVAAAVDTPLVVIEGPKGDPGAPGKDGHSPVVTATKSGKTTTISVDGAAIATVEDGADGKPGASGSDGITPTIGPNGNWYLGEEDTGKPSRGAIGAPGKDGNPGAPGKDGAPGVYYGTTQPTGDTHPVWIDPDGGPDDGGLLPAVTDADNGKVLRVVSGAWGPVDMPSGGSSDFVINGTLNDDDALTVDKTYAQIQEAVQGGKRVTLKVNKYTIDISLPLIGENDTGYIFEASLTVFPTVSLLFFASVSASGNSWNTDQLIVADSSGNLVQIFMDRDPEQPMEIATKQYVDDHAGVPSVTSSDNGKFLRVVNGAWAAADMPTGGTDMGITGAAVGQIAKISSVDASGTPTSWAPVDLPGGGGDEWVKVAETTLTEIANEIRLNFDPCKAVYIEFQYGAVEGNLGVIGIYPNPQTPVYTSEKRTCAVDTTTSDKNKRGYIFCTIDRRKGTQWVATSQIFNRGDGAFVSIQPGNPMNCDIGVSYNNTLSSFLWKEKLVGTDYINSVSAFGAGMNIGTTLTVWGIKA